MSTFNLFDQPTRIVESKTYGNYVVRRVGHLDPLAPPVDEAWSVWQETMHPRVFFRGACKFVWVGRAYDVYVPLLEDNRDWSPTGTGLEADCNKHRVRVPKTLPIGVDASVVLPWRKASALYID